MPTKSKSKRKMQPLSKDPSADNLVARLDDIRNHAVCTFRAETQTPEQVNTYVCQALNDLIRECCSAFAVNDPGIHGAFQEDPLYRSAPSRSIGGLQPGGVWRDRDPAMLGRLVVVLYADKNWTVITRCDPHGGEAYNTRPTVVTTPRFHNAFEFVRHGAAA